MLFKLEINSFDKGLFLSSF